MSRPNLATVIRELEPEEVETFRSGPFQSLVTVIEEDGKFILGRTEEQERRYLERRAGVLENGKDEDDTEEPEGEYEDSSLDEMKPLSASTGPRPLVVGGPCVSPKNAERDRVHAWAIELHKKDMPPGEIVMRYVEETKNDPRRLSAKQAGIVIVDRACKGRAVTGDDEFNCEKFETRAVLKKKLVRREGELHLVRNRILRGHLTVVGGDPSTGKTTFTWQVAAALSRGGDFVGEALPEGRVLIFCGEPKNDYQFDTFMGREEIGANMENVKMVWRADEDVSVKTIDRFRAIIADFEPDLIVLDPIEVYLGLGKGDGGQNDVVMQAGQPLYRIAEQTNAAILGTRFINKKGKLAGCPAFEGLCSRITHLEFDRSYHYQHLDPKLCPRIIRDRHDKIRIGCGDPVEQDLYWKPSSEGYCMKPVNGGYGKRKSVQVGGVLRRLFPYHDYKENRWWEIWGACRPLRVSERTVRRVMSVHGIESIDLPSPKIRKGDMRYVRGYLRARDQ